MTKQAVYPVDKASLAFSLAQLYFQLSPSLITVLNMEESISLEETNKIRISLGLKPLTDDSAPVDDKEKQAEQNYASQREQEAKAKEEK